MDFESLTREAEKKGWVEVSREEEKKGWVEASSGSYLCSQEHFMCEQAGWDEEFQDKSFDFTVAPFWFHTDTGEDPFPIRYEEDLEEVCN